MHNQQRKVRLLDGRSVIIEQTKPPGPYVSACIDGKWCTLSKSKIEKDSDGYVKA
jgi:hypothetical protein